MNSDPVRVSVSRGVDRWMVESLNRDHDDLWECATFISPEAERQARRFSETEYGYSPRPEEIGEVERPPPVPHGGPRCAPPDETTTHELHWVRRENEWDVWHWDSAERRWWTYGLFISADAAGTSGWCYAGPAQPPAE